VADEGAGLSGAAQGRFDGAIAWLSALRLHPRVRESVVVGLTTGSTKSFGRYPNAWG
jgi:hypothetical protein